MTGGLIPQQDYAMLKAAGVAATYGPGANVPEAAGEVLSLVRKMWMAAEPEQRAAPSRRARRRPALAILPDVVAVRQFG